jgi:hypothetical protein
MRPAIIVLACVAILAFILGSVGFVRVDSNLTVTTSAYMAAQLFTLESGASVTNPPLELEIARWLAPASTLGGLFAAGLLAYQKLRMTIEARLRPAKTILLGLNSASQALANQILTNAPENRPLHIVVPETNSANAESLRRAGALLIPADPTELASLASLQWDYVSKVVCSCGNDRDSIASALALEQLLRRQKRSSPLEVSVQVNDPAARDVLHRNGIIDLFHGDAARFTILNPLRNQARMLFDRYPLEFHEGDSGPAMGQDVSLFFPELDDLAVACLVQAARIAHFRSGQKLRIVVASTNAKRDVGKLRMYYPGIDTCVHMEAVEIGQNEFVPYCISRIHEGSETSRANIFLGSCGDEEGFATALLFRERLLSIRGKSRIMLAISADGVHRQMLKQRIHLSGVTSSFGFVPTLDECSAVDIVFDQSLDRVARIIHQTWLDEETLRIKKSGFQALAKPAFRPWDELDEAKRDNNRFAADHLNVKLRAAGLSPDDSDLESKWEELAPELLEEISRMEHCRWAAQLYLAGWTVSKTRDDSRRLHPNLVGYQDLDEPTREYDRQQVRNTARYVRLSCRSRFA